MGALAFDGSQEHTPVGHFTYAVSDDRWFWSDGVYELHGYAPEAVIPTTELMLQHKHPDDMARAFAVLEGAVSHGGPFSCYHRIIDAKERFRSVLSVGRGVTGPDGKVEAVTGFFVDLTDVRRAETQAEVEEALLRIAETRSVIDQAKGMLMLATGCDAEKAFGVLRTYSSHKNVKLHDLAHRLVDDVTARPLPDDHSCRSAVLAFLDGIQPYSGLPPAETS
jgi:hypothetical protein